jgi:hypothetical protein
MRWFGAVILLAGLEFVGQPAGAQVGHRPESSPYRDIRKGHTITAMAARFEGDGGKLNLAPHGGMLFGGRYDIRTGSTIQFGFGFMYGELERFIINPTLGPGNRRSGPVSQSLSMVELDLQFNVTGGKSWHRIAPYISVGGGLAIAEDVDADPSEFDFGNKFYFTPGLGTKLFLSDRLHLRGEVRASFWKLEYPLSFLDDPAQDPGTPPVLVADERSEWVTSPSYQVGVGYAFSL